MNFDLSKIDKVQGKAGTAKVSKFAPSKFVPRGRARPAQKAAASEGDKGEQTADRAQDASHQTEPSEALGNSGPPAASQAVPTSSLKAPAPAGEPHFQQQPAEARAMRSAAHKGNEPPATSSRPAVNTETALVAVPKQDDDEDTEDDEELPAQRKGKGKVNGRSTAQQLAESQLNLATMSMADIVKRANAIERVKQAAAKRRRVQTDVLLAQAEAAVNESDEEEAAPARPAAITAGPAPMSIAPQLEMRDGQLVPVAQSMVVQAQPETTYRRIVEENPKLNSASYSVRRSNDRWKPQETEAFFNAIRCFGQNYELISKLFPGRTRHALSKKYKKEQKLDPEKMDAIIDQYFKCAGNTKNLQAVVDNLANVQASADGYIDSLGMEASELVGSGSMAADGEEDAESDEAGPSVRGALPAPTSVSEEAAQPPSKSFRTNSRRKTAPAKSIPPDMPQEKARAAPGTAAGRSKRGRGGKAGVSGRPAKCVKEVGSDSEEEASEYEGAKAAPVQGSGRVLRSRKVAVG